nr:MAG TPA: hypothetical protein [Caudoviricetes sp.]
MHDVQELDAAEIGLTPETLARIRPQIRPEQGWEWDEAREPHWGMMRTDVLADERVTDRHLRVMLAGSVICSGWGYPVPQKPHVLAAFAGMETEETRRLALDLQEWGWLRVAG